MSNPIDRTGSFPSLRGMTRQAWRDLLSVYYANTPVWRWLKSGGLLLFGLAVWSGANVLLSYVPEWGFLTYVMAYGFLLIVWGPLTHFLVVPGIIRLRRTAGGPVGRFFARHGSKINLSVFLALVVVVGTLAPSVMMLEFSGGLSDSDGGDVSADLVCDRGPETIECHLEDAEGFDHVVVTSGGERLARVDEPPYAFTVQRDELAQTRTGAEFVVELRDEDGNTLRRFVRTV
ncbi:MAG: hypothetical protein ACI8U4_001578 [Natronomonas sp.]|jgi:hypothetical protein